VTRLVTVLVTLAVPEEADAEDAAALVADAAVCTRWRWCARPGSRVTCRRRAAWSSTAAASRGGSKR